MASDLVTTFSPNADRLYKTETITSSAIVGDNHRAEIIISGSARPRKGPPSASLLGFLVGGCKNHCILSYILGATLLASIFNTILLSFVIKSLQLNDRGFINGQISWDETLGATVFELPTSLQAGKSISLNSIESHKDKPLTFLLGESSAATTKPGRVFLSTAAAPAPASNKNPPSASDNLEVAKLELIAKSSYMAAASELDADAGSQDIYHRGRLEIGTKTLKLDLIDGGTLYGNANNGTDAGSGSTTRSNGRSPSSMGRLLEFDDESRSISLPLERELRMDPEQTSTSIVLELGLASDNIVGTHQDSLRVQTREGNLAVNCRNSLELMSKSASVKVSSLDELRLSSPAMSLSAGQGLYITNGVEYFDSEPLEGPARLLAAKVVEAARRDPELLAYSLLVADGILRAEAD